MALLRNIQDEYDALNPYDRMMTRKKTLICMIILSILITACFFLIIAGRNRTINQAVYLVSSEFYSVNCDGVDQELTPHQVILFDEEYFADYKITGCDDVTKTVFCKESGFHKILPVALNLSLFILFGVIGLFLYTEFMYDQYGFKKGENPTQKQ